MLEQFYRSRRAELIGWCSVMTQDLVYDLRILGSVSAILLHNLHFCRFYSRDC